MDGDKTALKKLTKSSRKLRSSHDRPMMNNYVPSIGMKAKWAINTACYFEPQSLKKKVRFLKRNWDKYYYDSINRIWTFKNIDTLKVSYKISMLMPSQLRKDSSEIWNFNFSKDKKQLIQALLDNKNPEALLLINKDLFSHRKTVSWRDYLSTFRILTSTSIAIENEKGILNQMDKFSYNGDLQYKLNAYWCLHFNDYEWVDSLNRFRNKLDVRPPEKWEFLVEDLKSKNSTKARKAYLDLIDSNEKLNLIGDRHNHGLNPIIPRQWSTNYDVIQGLKKQLTDNQLPIVLESNLIAKCDSTSLYLSRQQRKQTEEELAYELDLSTIGAYEIYLISNNHNSWIQESGARVLGILYAKRFNELLKSDRDLNLFLYKSWSFKRISPQGSSRSYHHLFYPITPNINARLKQINKTSSYVVKQEIEKIFKEKNDTCCKGIVNYNRRQFKITSLTELDSILDAIQVNATPNSNISSQFVTIFNRITFDLLPEALVKIPLLPYEERYNKQKWNFVSRNFGLDVGDLNNDTARANLMEDLTTQTAAKVYLKNLKRNGFNYILNDTSIDFQQIHDDLEHIALRAFMGQSVSLENATQLIKFLEFQFNTDLGYISIFKTEKSKGHKNIIHRCEDWQKYLINKALAKSSPTQRSIYPANRQLSGKPYDGFYKKYKKRRRRMNRKLKKSRSA